MEERERGGDPFHSGGVLELYERALGDVYGTWCAAAPVRRSQRT
jgi:hypothetical protein